MKAGSVVRVLLAGAVLAMAASAPPAAGAGEFTIYSSLPLQGDSRPQSEDIVRAMQMAIEDHGGTAGGSSINYVSLDDASPEFGVPDPELAVANAQLAAADGSTIAYIGEFNSFMSKFSIPILNEAGILQVSPSNTYVGLTRSEGATEEDEPERYYPTGNRTYGRVIPADHIQAAALVSYMQDEGCASVYILHVPENLQFSGLAAMVESRAAARGMQVLGNDGIDGPDWRPAVRKVTRAGADCFFFSGITQEDAVHIYRAVAAGSPGIKLFGSDGIAESAFTQRLGHKLESRMFITNPTLDRSAYPPLAQQFFAEFLSRYGRYPEPYAIYGYEAMSIVLDSIDNAEGAGSDPAGRQAIVDAFFGTQGRQSVLGAYDIDANGDTTLSDYGGFVVRNGEVSFSKVIDAAP